MKRRSFLLNSSIASIGAAINRSLPCIGANPGDIQHADTASDLYSIFKEPSAIYRPFVRWWWNGDKVDKKELSRELHLLKEAGIGGVEINPIQFPARTDDLGKESLIWLSNEWIDALLHTFSEARSMGLTCDLIVGSGWPFGAEYLVGEEQAQVMLIGTKKLEGKLDYEASLFDLLKEADPAVSSPHAKRHMEIVSVCLVPDPFTHMDQVSDLSEQVKTGYITTTIPKGRHVLYALVKITGFLQVINGAPGANGPVLNHYNKSAVEKYLNHMSDRIQQKIGPLSKHIRAFFTDSLELEGANWTADMAEEFKKRRGYDLMPFLPFTQFKIGSMGNVFDYGYGAQFGDEMKNRIQRVRYDFDLTKTELLKERFIDTFTKWCRDNKVKSRAQAYGRGYLPLEGSLEMDIPECETWIKAGIGKEMGEVNPGIGRGYTMVNKYVSSAAHLQGKRLISCEELTNTDVVFNATLELMKITGDLSTLSGVTHPVFHGFNYSPPEAPFPGWVRYGCYLNERNNLWPYFKYFTDYKARISALLQQADMFADIAILPPVPDMWSIYGAQNEPFPSLAHPTHLPLVWEAIHQNGNGCDYISETIIRGSDMTGGQMSYGSRNYHTLFLVQVESMEPATAEKLLSFVQNGGRIFCLDIFPDKSLGWNNYLQRDQKVQAAIEQMKTFPDRFILLKRPEKEFIQWYRDLQAKYGIEPYVRIDKPDPFVSQLRYRTEDTEILYFINSGTDERHLITIVPSEAMCRNKQGWIWNAETGLRYKLDNPKKVTLDLGPADSVLVVYDRNKKGASWKPIAMSANSYAAMIRTWTVEFLHVNGSRNTIKMDVLKDLKEIPEYVYFSGTAIYRGNLTVEEKNQPQYLNLGKVYGISELLVNGKSLGIRWYGRRIYHLQNVVQNGNNTIEIRVITTMGNYLKTLKDNAVAQYWTNEKRKDQPLQSMGLVGPVTVALER